MNSVELTGDEFKAIWNAKCSLAHLLYTLEDVLAAPLLKDLRKIKNEIDSAVSRPIALKDAEDERRQSHYRAVAEEMGYASIWSIYSVPNLRDAHPYKSACTLVYQGKSRDITHCVSWGDLWHESEMLIADSGDSHHVFIEWFEQDKTGEVLKLQTGS